MRRAMNFDIRGNLTDNLNNLYVHGAGGRGEEPIPFVDNSAESSGVTVCFRNLKANLVERLRAADAVLGCVAWLTDEDIISSFPDHSSIIVQKEDFLRPETGGPSKERLRRLYAKIGGLSRYHVPGVVNGLSVCSDPTIQGVRCCGNHNSTKDPAHARMHNKFVVFCEDLGDPNTGLIMQTRTRYRPYAVWTGSFNFTNTAGRSFENAVIITDRVICEAYAEEWSQIAAISEPLDWDSEWCSPQWRVGT